MTGLKPCPFCGRSEFVTVTDYEGDCSNCGYGKWGRRVVCSAAGIGNADGSDRHLRGCGASTGYADTDEQAIAEWNRRAA